MIQIAFMPPPMSRRRKTSANTVISKPDPDDEREEDAHRPENVEKRIVSRKHVSPHWSGLVEGTMGGATLVLNGRSRVHPG